MQRAAIHDRPQSGPQLPANTGDPKQLPKPEANGTVVSSALLVIRLPRIYKWN
jgi:hypothetical protein